jgi:hypothetical protein
MPVLALIDAVVPFKELRRRARILVLRQDGEWLAVQGIIVTAVFEFLPDAAADFYVKIERHREITLIE